MATLNTVFKQVFGEGLKEYGFVKIKGRQPYLVRVIGDEIIHVITCRNEWCGERGCKEFRIYGGVATVYRANIDLMCSPSDNINVLDDLSAFYSKLDPLHYDEEYCKKLMNCCVYKADDDANLILKIKHALEITKKIMVPVLDEVTDLESCINYFRIFGGVSMVPPKYKENSGDFGCEYGEGLLYIKTNNHNDFIKEVQNEIEKKIEQLKEAKIQFSPEIIRKNMEESRVRLIANRDQIYNNSVIYAKALEELERCKCANIERLKSYGLDIYY